MKPRPDVTALEDAYAEALAEIGRLQERLICGRVALRALSREVSRGQEVRPTEGADTTHSAHVFSD